MRVYNYIESIIIIIIQAAVVPYDYMDAPHGR